LSYGLDLAVDTPLRIVALDRAGVDVDLHVVSATSGACAARDDDVVAGTLAAGEWRIVVDTWSDGAIDYPGEFVLVVVPCDADDPGCASPIDT
jgi:hypothetical protein